MKTTPNFNQAEWHLYNYLKTRGITLRVGQVKDFRLDPNEDQDLIEKYANDYLSEITPDTDVTRKHGWWE